MANAQAGLARNSTRFWSEKEKSISGIPSTPAPLPQPIRFGNSVRYRGEKICCVARQRPFWQYQKRSFLLRIAESLFRAWDSPLQCHVFHTDIYARNSYGKADWVRPCFNG